MAAVQIKHEHIIAELEGKHSSEMQSKEEFLIRAHTQIDDLNQDIKGL